MLRQAIQADYLVTTDQDPEAMAMTMAGEQSSGTFVQVPAETDAVKQRVGANVVSVVPSATVASKSEPSPGGSSAVVTIEWPLDNIGPSLPNLMATVAGNLFELRALDGLRVLDIRLPRAFADAYDGPRFSVSGTRALAGVDSDPLIGTIVKPSIALTTDETAALVKELCEAGIDFIKDDELQSDGPESSFSERAHGVMAVINDHADRTGKKVMYAFNITGDLDQMMTRHELVVALGGTCVMASINSVGLVGMIELGRHTEVPIHAHRNGWGYLSRGPAFGWSYVAWQKIWRLAGADHLHVNGIDSKFAETNKSVVASAIECLTPLFDDAPYLAMPVFSSGQTVYQPAATYAAIGSTDLIFAAGGGVMAHPNGPRAGVESLRAAWSAATAGEDLVQRAGNDPDLRKALEAFQ